ncbi:hypothetical protein BIW11_04833, partial [Tropilaelaps mercedesae]
MAGQESETRDKDAPGVDPTLAPAAGEGQGVRPERAAAQLCQLKLKYEYAPQSPSKRRSDVCEQSPCSPSIETLLNATVRRVEIEVAKELLECSEGKRPREEWSPSSDGRTPPDAANIEREGPPPAKKLANGERRSSDSAAIIVKRKDIDSPICSTVTRSQATEDDVKEHRIKAADVVKCNGTAVPKIASQQKVSVPKVIVTKAVGGDATSPSSPKAVPLGKKEPSRPSDADSEKQSKTPDKVPVKSCAKTKTSDPSPDLAASNGACTKWPKTATPKKESTAGVAGEPETDLNTAKATVDRTPPKTHPDVVVDSPNDSNGFIVCAATKADAGPDTGAADEESALTELSTLKTGRVTTTTVTARKHDPDEDQSLISTRLSSASIDGECQQPGQNVAARLPGGTLAPAKRTLREPMSTDDVLESSSKKFTSASTPGSSPTAVRRKDLDTPVLSPVMKDIPENPSSPMTRSMSRRMEETTTPPGVDAAVVRSSCSNSAAASASSPCPSAVGQSGPGTSGAGGPRTEEPPIKKK